MGLFKHNKVISWVKVFMSFYLFVFLPFTALAQTTYQHVDSVKICKLLRQADRQTTTLWIARQFMGVPYVAHTLEVNDREQLVVNTSQLDCTTLVETVTALKDCRELYERASAGLSGIESASGIYTCHPSTGRSTDG